VDALRDETCQAEANGCLPANAELTKRPKEIPSWNSQTPDQKKLEARQMETSPVLPNTPMNRWTSGRWAAGDGVMDKTLFIYIIGDNGASAEGGPEVLTTK